MMILMTPFLVATLTAGPSPAPAPDDAVATQAYELRMNGKSDEARELLVETLAADDGNALVWYELARTHVYLLELDDATTAIDRAIALRPDAGRFHAFRGLTTAYNGVMKTKRPETRGEVADLLEQSAEAYARAVELDPTDLDSQVRLVNGLTRKTRVSRADRAAAKAHAEQLTTMDPVSGAEARTLLLPGKATKKAVKLWEQVVADHPNRADAHAGLANALLAANRLDDARIAVDKAIELDAAQRELLLDLGRSLALAKRQDDATSVFRRYLDTEPPLPAPRRAYTTFMLAVLEKQQGNNDAAEAMRTDAKAIDPHVWTTFRPPPAELFTAP